MQRTGYRPIGQPTYYFPPAVKWLLIVNVGVYVADFVLRVWFGLGWFSYGWLVPALVLRGWIWQLVTYMFLHSVGNVWHIVFNMLCLWMFGMDLERDWGTARFLRYYFLCGVAAGVCVVLVALLRRPDLDIPTLGASGAVLAVLLAYAVMYPDRIMLFMLIFPMKAKYVAMICGAIAFIGSWQGGSGVSHVAHLGGMVVGYIYLKARFKVSLLSPFTVLRGGYRNWRMERARRRFQVYLRKRGPGGGPWVN
ncbi:MAG: rhomboid family intramembrane serine protease [Bryobacteraceae bacterium]|jgi:membrane associated rhomboid family serine protease